MGEYGGWLTECACAPVDHVRVKGRCGAGRGGCSKRAVHRGQVQRRRSRKGGPVRSPLLCEHAVVVCGALGV